MSTQDSGQSAPERSNALVETGGVAAPGALAMPMPTPFGPMASQGQDVLRGGMDRSWFLNSLRRRWLLATCMSLLAAATVAGLLYWLLPETNSARAMYSIKADQARLLDTDSMQARDFETFKKTQLAYVRSQFVLQAALRANDSAIAKLSMFNGVDDEVDWLGNKLNVQYPNDGELLEISLAGPYPKEDLKQVVDAVSRAYYEEVMLVEDGQRANPLQILRGSHAELESKIREKMTAYQQIAKESDTPEAYQKGVDPQTQLMMNEVASLQNRKAALETQLTEATMNFSIFERQINDPSYQDRMVDEALEDDPTIAQMQQELMFLDYQVRLTAPTLKSGSSAAVRQLEQQRDEVNRQIAQRREQMRAEIAGESDNEPNALLKAESTAYQIQRGMIQQKINETTKRLELLEEELVQKAENNTDLLLRWDEIERLRKIEEGIVSRIQNLDVELDAPKRILAVGSSGAAVASTRENRNKWVRLGITTAGGIGTALLTCLGIGYMEFRNRRLNGPDQVEEGLGIRVIGTLPGLSGGKALNPRSPIVAVLNESIDNVRTAVMHESTTKRRRVLLVASAATLEGRTTVASQLAASLARAGRRTLLVDGDLRSPSLHTLFGAPLEDGLSEVLRAEAEVADVIRATQAEGLWLMTAGYCDGDAVRALATDQVQPIFDQLRNDYDFVIIDGAPVIGVSDSLLVGQHCDGVILSVLRDHSNVPQVHKAAETLRSVGIRLVGAVVNGVRSKADRRITHLQQVTPKSASRQLEAVAADE